MSSQVPVRLRAEHLDEALGIGTGLPRLSWQYTSDPNGFVQEAVEIEVRRPSGVTVYEIDGSEQVLVGWPAPALASLRPSCVAS
ncbi:MAG TPA: hypothetical protein VIK31_11085 [Propionibacteriaceae bacterium]